MTSDQLEEALGLTVGGAGMAFLVMVLLMALILGTMWVFGLRFVQRWTGALAAAEAVAAKRKKALAAAIAVRVALATGGASGHQAAQKDTSA